MRCFRRSVAWVVVVLVTVLAGSCGGSKPPSSAALSSRWSAPAILGHVPADTPYLIATLEPVSEALARRLRHGLGARFAQLLAEVDKLRADARGPREPWQRAVIALADALRGQDLEHIDQVLGLDPRGHFALYGLSLWPVLRVELANPAALRALIARVMAAAGSAPQQRVLDGKPYWIASGAELSFVGAVLEREAIAALVPTRAVDDVLPLVLGTRPAEPSLAHAATVPELLARHHFLGIGLVYVDTHQLVQIAVRDQPRPIDALLRGAIGPVPPACRGDLARIADFAPRIVMGYRAFDLSAFEASFVLELSARALHALARMHTAAPEVEARRPDHPMFAFGAAIEPDALIAGLREATRELHDHPFACPWLRGIGDAGAELGRSLDEPLPVMWRGLRGASLVIEDMSLLPPSVTGHAVLASARIVDLVPLLIAALPPLAGLSLLDDGQPVALPAAALGVPARSAHVAMTRGRLVAAAGDDSARRAAAHLAAPTPKRSPLLVTMFNAPRIQRLLEATGQPSASLGEFDDLGMVLDAASDGLHVDIWGTWARDPSARAR